MFCTLETSHAPIVWLKALASRNMYCMSSTLDTSHPVIGWLNAAAPLNMPIMLVTLDTFHPPIGWLNDSAPCPGSPANMLSMLVPLGVRYTALISSLKSCFPQNNYVIFVTRDMSQWLMCTCMLLLCRSTIGAPETHCLMDISIRSAQYLIDQERAKHLVDEIRIESYEWESLPQSIQSSNDHVKLFCCRWVHDLRLPSITYSKILKLRNNVFHLNQQSVIECWLTSRFEGVPRSLDRNQKWWFFVESPSETWLQPQKPGSRVLFFL